MTTSTETLWSMQSLFSWSLALQLTAVGVLLLVAVFLFVQWKKRKQ